MREYANFSEGLAELSKIIGQAGREVIVVVKSEELLDEMLNGKSKEALINSFENWRKRISPKVKRYEKLRELLRSDTLARAVSVLWGLNVGSYPNYKIVLENKDHFEMYEEEFNGLKSAVPALGVILNEKSLKNDYVLVDSSLFGEKFKYVWIGNKHKDKAALFESSVVASRIAYSDLDAFFGRIKGECLL